MVIRIHDRIREIIEKSPALTQKGLAERMGLNPAAVNRMLYGRRNIMAEEIPIIEDYLGVKLSLSEPASDKSRRGFSEALKQESIVPPDALPVPVYRLDGKADILQKEIIDWVPRHPAQAGLPGAFAAYVFTDAMEPRYYRGELVYIHPGRPAEAGRDCLIAEEKGGAFIARLVQETEGKLRVMQFNPLKEKDILKKNIRAIYAVVGRG